MTLNLYPIHVSMFVLSVCVVEWPCHPSCSLEWPVKTCLRIGKHSQWFHFCYPLKKKAFSDISLFFRSHYIGDSREGGLYWQLLQEGEGNETPSAPEHSHSSEHTTLPCRSAPPVTSGASPWNKLAAAAVQAVSVLASCAPATVLIITTPEQDALMVKISS